MTIVLYFGSRKPVTIRLFRRVAPSTAAIRAKIQAAREAKILRIVRGVA